MIFCVIFMCSFSLLFFINPGSIFQKNIFHVIIKIIYIIITFFCGMFSFIFFQKYRSADNLYQSEKVEMLKEHKKKVEEKLKQESEKYISEIKKKNAWTIIVSFIEKNPKDIPSNEVDKLSKLLKNKYEIVIQAEQLKYIIESEKGNILKKKELEQYEKELLYNEKQTDKSKKLDDKLIQEFRRLLKDVKSIDLIETKIKNWKSEGYDVSELEKMLEDVKK